MERNAVWTGINHQNFEWGLACSDSLRWVQLSNAGATADSTVISIVAAGHVWQQRPGNGPFAGADRDAEVYAEAAVSAECWAIRTIPFSG